MSDASVTLKSSGISAGINPLGAELTELADDEGRELLWNGDPAFWSGRAPLLFPVVGRLPGDLLLHNGRTYPMGQHGFARRRSFTLVEANAACATFRLTADEGTRAQYPFDFILEVTHMLDGAKLTITAVVSNPGTVPLPASFGFHPAFLWPLPYGGTRADHVLRFEIAESEPVHRPVGGLLSPWTEPNPTDNAVMKLDDAQFDNDALVFTELNSRHIRYGVPGEPGLEVAFEGMPHLGIWSKPGAPFVCIEPWQGYATPEGDERPFVEKPGLIFIPPGGHRSFVMSVRWLPDVGQ